MLGDCAMADAAINDEVEGEAKNAAAAAAAATSAAPAALATRASSTDADTCEVDKNDKLQMKHANAKRALRIDELMGRYRLIDGRSIAHRVATSDRTRREGGSGRGWKRTDAVRSHGLKQ